MAAFYDARLDALPSFNVFDALGVEKPIEDISIQALLERISLIMDLFQIPNLRPKELRESLFPAPWQVTLALSFLVSYDIKSGGPGTELRINQEHLALSLQAYGKNTYRRTFCPERGHEAPGEQRRTAVWPFVNFDALEPALPHPQPPPPSSHSGVSAPEATVSRRHGMVLSGTMVGYLQNMFDRANPCERIVQPSLDHAQLSHASSSKTSKLPFSGHGPVLGIPDPKQPTGFRNHGIVVRSQAPTDSSESDNDESTPGDPFPILALPPAANARQIRTPGTYVAGFAVMVGSPKVQSHLRKCEQQLVWATFTRHHHLVFTARQENAYGDSIPIEKLLRKKDGRYITAIKLRDINLFSPWTGLNRTALQRGIAAATWAAQLCGHDVQPVWYRKSSW